MKEYLIVVKADTNDADYIEETNTIDEDWLEEIKPVIESLKKDKSWPKGWNFREKIIDIHTELTEQQIDSFNDLCPHGENGIHSIESITLYEIVSKQILL